jgi:hypothetical protein
MNPTLAVWLNRAGTVLEVYGIWVALADYLKVEEVNFMVGPVMWMLSRERVANLRQRLVMAGLTMSLMGLLLELAASF